MNEPIEETYFNWLCAKVMSVEVPTPSLTYYRLLNEMHHTEFVWLLSGDDNRAEDGLDLRTEFVNTTGNDPDPEWDTLGCSVLEMCIALCRRVELDTGTPSREWFWTFMENLGLAQYNDASGPEFRNVSDILFQFIWREYEPNGQGGVFPLLYPQEDQREVEIWYQFCSFWAEKDYI